MNLTILIDLWRRGRLSLLWRLERMLSPFYRVCFLSAAGAAGVLRLLAPGPLPLSRLSTSLGLDPTAQEALAAWLTVGVKLGELRLDQRGYRLSGVLAKKLAVPEHDPEAALLEEVLTLHYALIRRLPSLLQEGQRFTLADQDGELIARSSRIMEPLVGAAMDAVIPENGPLRLLEVGCGSGIHIRHAMARNPNLTAVGVELQPEVAAAARRNLEEWGLLERVELVVGDIRSQTPQAAFDVATLHNNIYYFPEASRTGLLAFLHRFLKPGGTLLVTTACRGGSLMMEVLNLWSTATAGCGPLPTPPEMLSHLRQAGFARVEARKLYPFDEYYAFTGTEK